MSHLRDLNQQHPDNDANAPFWEWVDAMGGGPAEHEKAHEGNGEGSSRDAKHPYEPYHDHEDTEMPPPDYDGEDPPTPPEEYPLMNEKTAHLPDRTAEPENGKKDEKDGEGKRCGPGGRGGRGGRCGGRGGAGGPGAWHHGHHGHGPHGHGHGPWGHGPWGGRGRGGMFGRGRGGHWGAGGPPPFMFGHPAFGGGPFGGGRDGGPGNWGNWAEMAKKFAERLGLDPSQIPAMGGQQSNEDGVDFSPAIDVYSTPTEYVVHVALPGANKEDVAVTWDEAEAALNVGGVVTRGVDEELGNQLALAERPVGVFRRKIRLGDKEHPARVDADGIRATMEEGVLKIRVRKAEHEPAEIKKVQVQ